MEYKKNALKSIIETLKEDGFFENEWIDENKFRPRFINAGSKLNLGKDLGNDFETLFKLAEEISKDIIRENIDETMGSLIDKGLVTNVGDDEPAYKLNIDG